jgi:Zn-dependent metalloprotease
MDAPTVDVSLAYLQARAAEWGIRNAYEEFRLRQVARDALGQTHVRLDQVYQGVPVFGQQLIVHFDRDGTPQSATGAYLAGIAASTQPAISSQEARAVTRQRFPGALAKTPEAELVLYPEDGDVRLVYRVVLKDDETPRRIVAFVDAMTGQVVHSYNDLRTLLPSLPPGAAPLPGIEPMPSPLERPPVPVTPAVGTGHSLYSGTVSVTTDQSGSTFSLIDTTRGGLRTSDKQNRRLSFGDGTIFTDADNNWGDGTASDRASAGVDAHFGAALTWDYYLSIHARTGIYDDGIGTLSRVHFKQGYNNAFWRDSCQCMTYGDGDGKTFTPLVSLDVAGHEMTHGVTSATAALIYRNESGGLNEAMSDIFGTMVEFFAAAHGASKTPNYWIGEDIYTPGTPGDALRYMDDPTRDDHSIDTFADYVDGLNVHYSSGIANNAFFLLAEGGVHRLGGMVTGIGRSAAERIFYRALTVYMIPSETFSQARAHTVQAAIDLFGPGSQQVISVDQAWSVVGVP